jgi:CRP-like cAMP-binding protein
MEMTRIGATLRLPEPVGRNRLLAALPAADFALLEPHLTPRGFDRGAVLQQAGSPIEQVYFPHAGLISLVLAMPDGQNVEIALVGREGAIGLTAGIGSQLALNGAVMQSAGSGAEIAALALAEIAARSSAIRGMIVAYNDVLIAQIQQMAACNAVHDVEARLSRWLLQARDRIGSNEVMITQEALAELLCVRRTTVTLVCRTLQMRDVIHVRRGRIEIRDGVALERSACSCYRATRAMWKQ